MRILFFILVFCFPLGLEAQSHHWGITFGGTMGWIDQSGNRSYDAVNCLTVDGYYTFRKGHFISKCALALQQNGNSRELLYFDTLGAYISNTIEKRRFSYLGINELVGIEYGSAVRGYIAAGFNFGVYLKTGVSAHDATAKGQIIKGYSYNEYALSPVDLAGTIEAGLGVEMFNEDYLFVIGSYNHGLMNISNRKNIYEPSWNNNFLSVRVGVRHIVVERKDKRKAKDSKDPSTFDSQ